MQTWMQFCFGGHGEEHAHAWPSIINENTTVMAATSISRKRIDPPAVRRTDCRPEDTQAARGAAS